MSDFSLSDNINQYRLSEAYLQPFRIDQASPTLFYIGWIDNPNLSTDPTEPIWRIKRIIQNGSVWQMGYPDGDTSFAFVWDDRSLLLYN